MAIDVKLIDKLLADYKKPEDIIGENGLLKQLTKALLERAMQAEMTDHLGYEKHDPVGNNSGNSRNGATTKTLKGDFGEMPLVRMRESHLSQVFQNLLGNAIKYRKEDEPLVIRVTARRAEETRWTSRTRSRSTRSRSPRRSSASAGFAS